VELFPVSEKYPTCGVAVGAQDEYLVTLVADLVATTAHTLFAQTIRVQRATPPIE
jgi:hypothetical protein